MDQMLAFAKDYWVILGVVLIAVVVINFFLKTVFKLINIAIVIGVILVFGFNYTPAEVVQMGNKAVEGVNDMFMATVKPLIEQEIKNADYKFNPDGSYEVKTKNVRIQGKKGDPKATVSYKDYDFKVNINDLGTIINDQIKQAQQKQ